ncbi:hypothetical protein QTP88_017864 [Uroleucon formosanum]
MSDSEGTSTSVPQNNKNASSPDSPPPLRRSINGIFFKFLPEKSCASESKMVVQCVKCEPKIVELKGYGNSSSNFVTHIKRRHGNNAAEEYKNHLRSIGPPNKKIKTFVKQLKIKTTQENFENINKKNYLREQDFDYIEEHLLSIVPMAEAFDIMQGETNTYYGVVLPCLLALRRKIETLAKPERIWLYCKPIIDAILKSIDKRFENYLNFSSLESVNASIAAVSYPPDDVITAQNTPLHSEKSPIINQTTDDFFDFGSSSSALTGTTKSELEVLHF